MRDLKSQFQELRRLYEHAFAAHHIAEQALVDLPTGESTSVALRRMQQLDLDVLPLREPGGIRSYVERSTLGPGCCADYRQPIDSDLIVADSASLSEVMAKLHDSLAVFVGDGDDVKAIITREDLQKMPVRMWLFGLVSLLEMHLLRLIRTSYPDESWLRFLSPARRQLTRELLVQRRQRNENVELADCLEFCDKRDLALRHPDIRARLGVANRRQGERLLVAVESLRDRLAHAQDLAAGSSWPELIDLAKQLSGLLEYLEAAA